MVEVKSVLTVLAKHSGEFYDAFPMEGFAR